MDVTYLKSNLPQLLDHMRMDGYSISFIKMCRSASNHIIKLAVQFSWTSYDDARKWFAGSEDFSKRVRHEFQFAINIIEKFDNSHELPKHPVDSYQLLRSLHSAGNLDLLSLQERLQEFEKSMMEKGCNDIADVTEDTIVNYLKTQTSNKGKTKLPGLSLFMRDCIPYNPYEFRRLYGLIPIKYGYRKTVQFLTLEECKSFNEALEDMSNDLSLKQRAIGEILFHTAMRSCDIANLQLDSVDLQRQIINFTQIKTGKELTLPLLPAVGNAIYDYCTMERPISDSSILFLGDFAPHHKMTSQAVYYIVSKIMKRAEIRQKPGDRQGAHIFRHHAATTMLENNVPVPVISATLGHQSPKSLDSYLAANIPHLHECALSIDEYPVSEEVFNFDGV